MTVMSNYQCTSVLEGTRAIARFQSSDVVSLDAARLARQAFRGRESGGTACRHLAIRVRVNQETKSNKV